MVYLLVKKADCMCICGLRDVDGSFLWDQPQALPGGLRLSSVTRKQMQRFNEPYVSQQFPAARFQCVQAAERRTRSRAPGGEGAPNPSPSWDIQSFTNLGWLKKVCLPEFSALRGAVRDEKSWVPFMFVRPGREGDILLATWVL